MPLIDTTITVDQLSGLQSGDFAGFTLAQLAEGEFYRPSFCRGSSFTTDDGNYVRSPWKRHSEEYIVALALQLLMSDEWPFPPLSGDTQSLWNGHHRSMAALLIGYKKPIPFREYHSTVTTPAKANFEDVY